MKDLKELITFCKIKVLNGGKCPMLKHIESDYKNEFAIPHTKHHYDGQMSEEVGTKIADAYAALSHNPNNKLVDAAYAQLAKEVLEQFRFLNKRENVVYEPYEGTGEPYKNSFQMLYDFHNFHLYFFKTEKGFGESEYLFENKMLQPTGIMFKEYELVVNDLFRIVHDLFGHAMDGNGFGAGGEDQAWFTHTRMFSPLAAAALSTETRGQNCWVNFGPHLRDTNGQVFQKGSPHYVPPQNRPFAEQKMNLLPSHISGVEVWEDDDGSVKAEFLSVWDPFLSVVAPQSPEPIDA